VEEKLIRIGTTYIPVQEVEQSAGWYERKLNATINYQDEDKAILNLANQSIFLVKSQKGEKANFIDSHGVERFSITFEVDGVEALKRLRQDFQEKGIKVGNIEDRGHQGNNFVFEDIDGNKFDVWSELSPIYKTLIMK
jgi:catechol-2,3-dioxygenase